MGAEFKATHVAGKDACVARELDTLDGAELMLPNKHLKVRCTLFYTVETKGKQKIDNIYLFIYYRFFTEKQNFCNLFFYFRFLFCPGEKIH